MDKKQTKNSEFTFAQALNFVLLKKFRRLDNYFTDSDGGRWLAKIFHCGRYVRVDFVRKEYAPKSKP